MSRDKLGIYFSAKTSILSVENNKVSKNTLFIETLFLKWIGGGTRRSVKESRCMVQFQSKGKEVHV
jgi:hypothetical protein